MCTTSKNMTADIDGGYGTVTVERLTRRNGPAGQIVVEIESTYVWSDGEPERLVSQLVGSTYGAPLVYVTSSGAQCFVTDAGRFGSFESDPIEYARRYTLNDR